MQMFSMIFSKNREAYFKKYHSRFWNRFRNKTRLRQQFRGEGLDEWIEPVRIEGNNIKNLQRFLNERGFMPGARLDGIFDYWTLSSVRLFQEYIRTVEGIEEIGVADGRVWNGTHKHMIRWVEDDLYCHWGPDRSKMSTDPFYWSNQTKEYALWLSLLERVKAHYIQKLETTVNPEEDVELFQLLEIEKFHRDTDTLKIHDWTFNPKDIHLIGFRCFQERKDLNRGNDDLFVLLMNGMVFKFWGSADPRPYYTQKFDGLEPYLVEGQHKYIFGWHKTQAADSGKVYKSLVPAGAGVLVFRDWSKTDALNEGDIREGLSYNKKGRRNPNGSINIHWTADGTDNWSAGCQVISGRSYVNDKGKLIDSSEYSANKYVKVSHISKPGVTKNRGAYTFLSDFVFAYSEPSEVDVLFTLGRDGILEKFADRELLEILNTQIPGAQLILDGNRRRGCCSQYG